MLVIWVGATVAFALLRAYVLITGKGLNLHNKLQKKVFFRDLIMLCIEGYLTFLIIFFLKFFEPDDLE
jgi:hypothetical protein